MDSQLTLIPPAENILLIFDRDDMQNTTLRTRGSYYPTYIVTTAQDTTIVYTGNGTLLATVTRRLLGRDKITFPGCKPMNLTHWLKAPILSALPLAFHVFGRRFKWKQSFAGQLLLYESSRPGDVVAWFSKGRRAHSDGALHPAYLAIKPELADLKDTIVLSCILAEYKLRVSQDCPVDKGAVYYAMILSH